MVGFARSGGTILGLAIGSAPRTLAAGEIAFFREVVHEHKETGGFGATGFCSCGEPNASCPLWSAVEADVASDPGGDYASELPGGFLERAASRPRAIAGHVLDSLPVVALRRLLRSGRLDRQLASTEALVRSIARIGRVETVIDTGRLPDRAWYYLLMPGLDVRFVHVVRDGRAVLEGVLAHLEGTDLESRPAPHPRATALSVAAGWVYNNLLASLVGLVANGRYLRVRYEDLMDRPAETLRRIGVFLNLEMGEVIHRVEHGERLEPGHILQGNRTKFDPVLRTGPAAAEPSRRTVPAASSEGSWTFGILTGWLLRGYGYRSGERTGSEDPL